MPSQSATRYSEFVKIFREAYPEKKDPYTAINKEWKATLRDNESAYQSRISSLRQKIICRKSQVSLMFMASASGTLKREQRSMELCTISMDCEEPVALVPDQTQPNPVTGMRNDVPKTKRETPAQNKLHDNLTDVQKRIDVLEFVKQKNMSRENDDVTLKKLRKEKNDLSKDIGRLQQRSQAAKKCRTAKKRKIEAVVQKFPEADEMLRGIMRPLAGRPELESYSGMEGLSETIVAIAGKVQ
jgi:hypothetical protein